MLQPPESEYLVPYDGSFRISSAPCSPPSRINLRNKKRLKLATKRLDDLQQALFAADKYALLVIFQGMDAAGKDSTIRSVMQGINPAGCQVFGFKKPSAKELDHDFLWRCNLALPERGRIGIFNRSHYEEVLVVRVHPGILESQKLPQIPAGELLWQQRYESIRDFEKHISRNGTIVIKFWLNVSQEEQKCRFLSRLDNKDKQWKFNPSDISERAHWDKYMQAYEHALNETSRPFAPWYAIPADNKPFMRATVAEIIVRTLESANIKYPTASVETMAQFDDSRKSLTNS